MNSSMESNANKTTATERKVDDEALLAFGMAKIVLFQFTKLNELDNGRAES